MPASQRNTTRQREAGAASRQETRRRLLAAAAVEFAEGGYTKATVNRIAARAGVTVPTLYLSWGSKRELLRAFMESALGGEPDTSFGARLPHLIDTALADTAGDARAVLRHIAHLFREIAERSALGWQLYRDAAGTDPAIAQDWQVLQRLRKETFSALIARLPRESSSLRVDQGRRRRNGVGDRQRRDLRSARSHGGVHPGQLREMGGQDARGRAATRWAFDLRVHRRRFTVRKGRRHERGCPSRNVRSDGHRQECDRCRRLLPS